VPLFFVARFFAISTFTSKQHEPESLGLKSREHVVVAGFATSKRAGEGPLAPIFRPAILAGAASPEIWSCQNGRISAESAVPIRSWLLDLDHNIPLRKVLCKKGRLSASAAQALLMKNHLAAVGRSAQGVTSVERNVPVGKQCWSVGKNSFNPAAGYRPQAWPL
jgi:hypothetical protein